MPLEGYAHYIFFLLQTLRVISDSSAEKYVLFEIVLKGNIMYDNLKFYRCFHLCLNLSQDFFSYF